MTAHARDPRPTKRAPGGASVDGLSRGEGAGGERVFSRPVFSCVLRAFTHRRGADRRAARDRGRRAEGLHWIVGKRELDWCDFASRGGSTFSSGGEGREGGKGRGGARERRGHKSQRATKGQSATHIPSHQNTTTKQSKHTKRPGLPTSIQKRAPIKKTTSARNGKVDGKKRPLFLLRSSDACRKPRMDPYKVRTPARWRCSGSGGGRRRPPMRPCLSEERGGWGARSRSRFPAQERLSPALSPRTADGAGWRA